VAEVVLDALNVGQDRVAAIVAGDQAHRDAGDRRLDRHPRIYQRQDAAADARHRGRAVRADDLGDDSDRVRELVGARNHREEGPLGERVVADLAPVWGVYAPHLAGGKRRYVVVVYEALVLFEV